MKILITGANGLLGSNLVRELLEREYNVSTLIEEGQNPFTLFGLNVNILYGNILKPKELTATIKGMDIVIHCAANTNIWPARSKMTCQVNIEGTENVIDACLRNKVKRLIFVGTANSFGSGDIGHPGEENAPYSAGIYGLDYMDSKRIAQEKILEAVKTKNLPALIVNPTFMLGAYDSKPSSGAMILAIAHGKIPMYTQGGKNFINVKDAAVGIANAITLGRIGECYILGNENLTYKNVFQKIATVVGTMPPKRSMPSFIVKGYGRFNSVMGQLFKYSPSITHQMSVLSCENHYYSSKKAVDELNLPQTPLENGILDSFDWFKANGYVNKMAK